MYQFEAVILAGGRSSRMGRDKALLPFANYSSLTQYQYQRLLPLFKRVSISTKDRKFSFDAPLILDKKDESSPLIALETILSTIKSDIVFILGVDLPFVGEDIIKSLVEVYNQNSKSKAIISKSSQGVEPLCAIYTKSLLPKIKKAIKANNHRLQDLLNSESILVDFKDSEAFMNLNNPQIYQKALSRL